MDKIGRNDACPCGSGKKYKQCCMRAHATPAPAPIPSAHLLQLAFARHMAGFVDEARAVYRDIAKREPRNADAWHLLGVAAGDSGDFETAIGYIGKAIAIDAGNHSFHANLGRMFALSGDHADAARCYRRALALRNEPTHHDNLGNALRAQDDFDGAEASYRRAIALDANYVNAHRNLGDLLQLQHRIDDALACYRHALALQPGNAEICSNLGTLLQIGGDYAGAMESFRGALALDPTNSRAADNLVYAASVHLDPADYLALARERGAQLLAQARADPAHASFSAAQVNTDGARQALRIGFVSGDLRDHPVGSFLESILPHLHAQRLELFAYATTRHADAATQRMTPYFTRWQSLAGLPAARAAQAIRADRIDVLIDLAGYTAGNRLDVFAWKPAPVQASWLGYWASTGLAAIDHVLVDPYSAPTDDAAYFSERIARLPQTRLCYTPPRDAADVSPLPAAINGYVTFGCFNNPAKIGADVVAAWSRILQRLPSARLCLKARQFADARNAAHMRERFAAQGIAGERIDLLQETARADYFAAYGAIDIALDPYPFTGATTSLDGLWMGVPFVTLRGDRMVARQGESILHNLDLTEWIADDVERYAEIALARAGDLQRLAELRGALRSRLLQSPLCDASRFAEVFGETLWRLWRERSQQ